jgi:hypothetical protein
MELIEPLAGCKVAQRVGMRERSAGPRVIMSYGIASLQNTSETVVAESCIVGLTCLTRAITCLPLVRNTYLTEEDFPPT